MAIAATLFEAPSLDRREAERRLIHQDSTMRDLAKGAPHTVLVHNLSAEGLQLETPLDLALGTDVSVGLPGVGMRTLRVVRRDGNLYGCRFAKPVSPALLSQAFVASSVVEAPFARLSTSPFPEPSVRKWHPAIRLVLLLGGASALWALILRLIHF